MINFKQIGYIIGSLLYIEAMFMLLSGGVALYYGEKDLPAFLMSSFFTGFTGCLLVNHTGRPTRTIRRREGLFVVSATWFVFSVFGSLPFYISQIIPSWIDAFFETVSGFTTTGSSIIANIELMPHGILFWRSLSQWLGGMGIIVFTLAILPLLGNSGGGQNLYNFESTGLVHNKLQPRIGETAKRLWGMYIFITLLEAFLLLLGPMDFFDALCHSLTTAASGGFSTKQTGLEYWHSTYIESVVLVFMFLAGINFTLIFLFALGKFKKIRSDEEFRWYIRIICLASLAVFLILEYRGLSNRGIIDTLRLSFFQVVAAITSTGFSLGGDIPWGRFFFVFFSLLMIPGGCSGGTAGGMKIIRIVVLMKNFVNEFYRNVHPNAVVPVRINHQVVSQDLVFKVLAYLSIYVGILFFSMLFLAVFGVSLKESFGLVASALSNVGFSLGEMWSPSTYIPLSPVIKIYLAFLMVVGRLELFTVLTLFTPAFWKK